MAKIVKEVEVTKLLVETDEGYLETDLDPEVEKFIQSREWHKSNARISPGRKPRSY